MKRDPLVLAPVLLLALAAPAGADQVYEGWNEGDTAGWEVNTSRTALEVVETGGVDDSGYLYSYEVPPGFDIVGAKQGEAPYAGDYGAHGYRRMEVAAQFFGGTFTSVVFRLRYLDGGHNGWYCSIMEDFTPGAWRFGGCEFDPEWTDAEAMAAGWHQEPYTPSFQETLANVYTAELRVMGAGDLEIGFDEFRLLPGSSDVSAEPPAVGGVNTWSGVKQLYGR